MLIFYFYKYYPIINWKLEKLLIYLKNKFNIIILIIIFLKIK